MSKANLLERRSVVAGLLADRKDAVVVGGLAPRPMILPPPAIMTAISICGARWAAPS